MSVRSLSAASMLMLVASCSTGASEAADAQFPEAELTSTTSSAHGLRVAVRTAPDQPPQRGTCAVELRVDDKDGAPVDGLDVTVVPWMPAHGHGASVSPTVTAKGGGRYVASDVNLFMAGQWQLRTSFHGPVDDDATATFVVP